MAENFSVLPPQGFTPRRRAVVWEVKVWGGWVFWLGLDPRSEGPGVPPESEISESLSWLTVRKWEEGPQTGAPRPRSCTPGPGTGQSVTTGWSCCSHGFCR